MTAGMLAAFFAGGLFGAIAMAVIACGGRTEREDEEQRFDERA